MRFCAPKVARRRASAVTLSRASGSPTVLMRRRTENASGSSVRHSPGCTHKTTALPASAKAGAVETLCWPESRRMWACVRDCMFGWQPIGTLRIPPVRSTRPYAATSVLELRSNFDYILKEERLIMKKLSLLAVLLASMLAAPLVQAQITHVDMRVEGMT